MSIVPFAETQSLLEAPPLELAWAVGVIAQPLEALQLSMILDIDGTQVPFASENQNSEWYQLPPDSTFNKQEMYCIASAANSPNGQQCLQADLLALPQCFYASTTITSAVCLMAQPTSQATATACQSYCAVLPGAQNFTFSGTSCSCFRCGATTDLSATSTAVSGPVNCVIDNATSCNTGVAEVFLSQHQLQYVSNSMSISYGWYLSGTSQGSQTSGVTAETCGETCGNDPACVVAQWVPGVEKDGNNGAVSCTTYCQGSAWGTVFSYCMGAVNTATGVPISCDTTPGYLQGPQLTCYCSNTIVATGGQNMPCVANAGTSPLDPACCGAWGTSNGDVCPPGFPVCQNYQYDVNFGTCYDFVYVTGTCIPIYAYASEPVTTNTYNGVAVTATNFALLTAKPCTVQQGYVIANGGGNNGLTASSYPSQPSGAACAKQCASLWSCGAFQYNLDTGLCTTFNSGVPQQSSTSASSPLWAGTCGRNGAATLSSPTFCGETGSSCFCDGTVFYGRTNEAIQQAGLYGANVLLSNSFCGNRGCSGGLCTYSSLQSTLQACANWVGNNPYCGDYFDYGGGYCDCTPVGVVCTPVAFADYVSYQIFAPTAVQIPLPSSGPCPPLFVITDSSNCNQYGDLGPGLCCVGGDISTCQQNGGTWVGNQCFMGTFVWLQSTTVWTPVKCGSPGTLICAGGSAGNCAWQSLSVVPAWSKATNINVGGIASTTCGATWATLSGVDPCSFLGCYAEGSTISAFNVMVSAGVYKSYVSQGPTTCGVGSPETSGQCFCSSVQKSYDGFTVENGPLLFEKSTVSGGQTMTCAGPVYMGAASAADLLSLTQQPFISQTFANSQQFSCSITTFQFVYQLNLNQNGANLLSNSLNRCLYRFTSLLDAQAACNANSLCTQVTQDNGLTCNNALMLYELRSGSLAPVAGFNTWSKTATQQPYSSNSDIQCICLGRNSYDLDYSQLTQSGQWQACQQSCARTVGCQSFSWFGGQCKLQNQAVGSTGLISQQLPGAVSGSAVCIGVLLTPIYNSQGVKYNGAYFTAVESYVNYVPYSTFILQNNQNGLCLTWPGPPGAQYVAGLSQCNANTSMLWTARAVLTQLSGYQILSCPSSEPNELPCPVACPNWTYTPGLPCGEWEMNWADCILFVICNTLDAKYQSAVVLTDCVTVDGTVQLFSRSDGALGCELQPGALTTFQSDGATVGGMCSVDASNGEAFCGEPIPAARVAGGEPCQCLDKWTFSGCEGTQYGCPDPARGCDGRASWCRVVNPGCAQDQNQEGWAFCNNCPGLKRLHIKAGPFTSFVGKDARSVIDLRCTIQDGAQLWSPQSTRIHWQSTTLDETICLEPDYPLNNLTINCFDYDRPLPYFKLSQPLLPSNPCNKCCTQNCTDATINSCVDAILPWCTLHEWDDQCREIAITRCGLKCPSECLQAAVAHCCQPYVVNCGNSWVGQKVCGFDPACCTGSWDLQCVTEAKEQGLVCSAK